jgi:hypothetical protein
VLVQPEFRKVDFVTSVKKFTGNRANPGNSFANTLCLTLALNNSANRPAAAGI